MSRRQHVVRTDEQGPIGTPRSLGDCQIFCESTSRGSSPELMATTETVTPITITSTRNYQRCFISAAVDNISVTIPDPAPPPGPGTWTTRFECNFAVPEGSTRWCTNTDNASTVWGGTAEVITVDWGGNADFVSVGNFTGITEMGAFGDFNDLWDLVGTAPGPSTLDPPHPVTTGLRLEVSASNGPVWCTLTYSSLHGEFMEDGTISDGAYHG